MSLDPKDLNTDRYYANKRPGSPFRQSAADSTRKPRQVLPPGYSPVPTPVFNRDDTTTDKYYAEGGSKSAGAGQPVARPPARLPLRHADPAAGRSFGVVLVEIPDAAALGEGVAMAKLQVRAGARVEIGVGDKELIARVNTALDGAVSREEITEDQRREVRVGVKAQGFQTAAREDLPAENRRPDEVFGAPAALGTKHVAADPDGDLDIDAFLSGGAVDEEDEKHATLTGGSVTGDRPPAAEPEEDNDFLAPDPAAAEVDRMVLADIKALSPDLAKVPQQPKTSMGVPGGVVRKDVPEL